MKAEQVAAAMSRFENVLRTELMATRGQLAALQGQVTACNAKLDALLAALADEVEEPIPDDGLDAPEGKTKASHEL